MFLQIVGQSLTHGLLHGSSDLRVAELRLRLSLELRLSHLDANHCCKAFAEVFGGNLDLRLLNLLGDLRVVIGVLLQGTCEGCTETSQVGSTLDGVDVIYIGMDIFRVVGVVHHGHLDGDALLLGLQVDDIVDKMGTMTIHIAHELLQSVLGMEHLRLTHFTLLIRTQVTEGDGDAGIQIGQLTHTTGDDVVLIFGGGEDGAVGPELLAGTCLVGIANDLHVVEGLSLLILLLVDMTITVHLRQHVRRQSVHTAHTHTVQTTRDLIGTLVELTSGMEHGHHDLEGALMHLLVLVDRDTTTVIKHGNRVVLVDGHLNMRAVAGHRLVDGVVDGLVHQVVQTLLTNIANIHGRTLTHSLQALKYLDVTRGIILFLNQLFFCHLTYNLTIYNVLFYFACKGTKKKSDKHSLSAKKLQKRTAAPLGTAAVQL